MSSELKLPKGNIDDDITLALSFKPVKNPRNDTIVNYLNTEVNEERDKQVDFQVSVLDDEYFTEIMGSCSVISIEGGAGQDGFF